MLLYNASCNIYPVSSTRKEWIVSVVVGKHLHIHEGKKTVAILPVDPETPKDELMNTAYKVAAAPELYEAVKVARFNLVCAVEEGAHDHQEYEKAIETCDKAILKAEGKDR